MGRTPTWMVFPLIIILGLLVALTPRQGMAADITWTNTAGGNWSTAANWNSGAGPVPGSGDVAHITTNGTYTVTLDVSPTIAGLDLGAVSGTQTLYGVDRSLTLNGASTVNTQGKLHMARIAVGGSGSLAVAGEILSQGGQITIGLTTAVGSRLRIQEATLTVASGFINLGAIEVGTDPSTNSSLEVTSGTLVNAIGATIELNSGPSGERRLAAELNNQGTLTVAATTGRIERPSADHVNSGTIAVTGNLTVVPNGGGSSFTNTGAITVASARTLTFDSQYTGGTLSHNAGSISGSGTLLLFRGMSGTFNTALGIGALSLLSSGSATLTSNLTTATTALKLEDNSTLGGTVTVTNVPGQTVLLARSTINTAFINQGTLIAVATPGSINGALTTAAGSLLRVGEAPGWGGGADLTVASGFTNLGAIEVGGDPNANYSLGVTSGTLVNAIGATIELQSGAAGERRLTAELNNQGTLTVAATTGRIERPSADHVNSGTIAVTGNLTVVPNGGGSSFTNTGAITVASARTLTFDSQYTGGTLSHNAPGSISGSGTLLLFRGMSGTFNTALGIGALSLLSSGSATLTSNLTTATTALKLEDNSTLGGTVTVTNVPGQTVLLARSTINTAFINQGTLIAVATPGSINGALTTAAGSLLRVGEAPGWGGGADLTVASGFTNLGAIEVGGDPNANYSLGVTSGTLVNAIGATIELQSGAAGERRLTAELNNQGTLTVAATMGRIERPSADHVNSGTIAVTGNLTVVPNGGGSSFTNTGAITVASARTLTFDSQYTGGTLSHNAGSISGSGTLLLFRGMSGTFNTALGIGALSLLSSGSATLTSNLTTATTALKLEDNSTLGGTVTVTNVPGQTVLLARSTINTAFINQGTLIAVASPGSINGTLTTAAGSLVRVGEAPGWGGGADLTVANGFTNLGAIEVGGDPGAHYSLAVTSGTLVNAMGATIELKTGTAGERRLTAELDNQGTLTVAATVGRIERPSADHVNSGTIAVTGNLTVVPNGSGSSFTNTGAITVASARTLTFDSQFSGGTLSHNAPGSISGGGTVLLFRGMSGTFNTALGIGALSLLTSGSATLTSDLTTATTALKLEDNSTLGGTVTVTNVPGQTVLLARSTINTAFINQGTLIAVASPGSINGTLTTAAGSLVRVGEAPGWGGGADLTVANGFTNLGAIEVGGDPGAHYSLAVTSGTLVNAMGATIELKTGTAGERRLTAELNNQGTLTVAATVGRIERPSADHVNSGTIAVTGNLTVFQSGSAPSFTNTGAITVSSSRTLTSTTGTFLNAVSGVLRGTGTCDFGTTFTNAGSIAPGASPGILNITGSAPFSGGTLDIDVDGLTVGTGYDRLAVTGNSTVDGVLRVTFAPGLCPTPSDQFRVLTAGSLAGTFDGVEVLGAGKNPIVDIQYDGTGVTVVVVSSRPVASAPVNGKVRVGGSFSFDPITATSPPYTFAWRKNGVPIPGADSSSYSLIDTPPSAAGAYDVMVCNACGCDTSAAATLTVCDTLRLTVPSSRQATVGDASHAIPATIKGTGAVQWYREDVALTNGADYSGTTTATLTILSPTSADLGFYEVRATDACSTVVSNRCKFVIVPCQAPLNITVEPADRTVARGTPTTFSVTATSCATPLTYRWSFQALTNTKGTWTLVAAGASPSFTISSVQASHEGSYRCVVSSVSGSRESRMAGLNAPKPKIVSVTAKPLSCNSARIIWKTDRPTRGTLKFGASCATLTSSVSRAILSTLDSAVVSRNGASSAAYKLTVTDAGGRTADSPCNVANFDVNTVVASAQTSRTNLFGSSNGGILTTINLSSTGCDPALTGLPKITSLTLNGRSPRKESNAIDLPKSPTTVITRAVIKGRAQFVGVTRPFEFKFSRAEVRTHHRKPGDPRGYRNLEWQDRSLFRQGHHTPLIGGYRS